MAATVEIDEQNGKADAPILTHNIANTNMGSADTVNLVPTTCPVAPGENTCEKWQLIHVVDINTSTRIQNIKIWRGGVLGDGATHLCNLSTTKYSGAAVYTTPTTATSLVAVEVMPESAPGTANLGINGSLTGTIVNSGYSDFFVHQIQTNSKAISGNTSTLNYSYDEIA